MLQCLGTIWLHETRCSNRASFIKALLINNIIKFHIISQFTNKYKLGFITNIWELDFADHISSVLYLVDALRAHVSRMMLWL
jgi:hypothetical protein